MRLKITLLTFTLTTVLSSNSVYSQDMYEGDIRFGLGISPNLSWYTTSTANYESDGNKAGWSWGLNFDYFFRDTYAFSTGLHMLSYGGKLKNPDLVQNQVAIFRAVGFSDVRYSAIQIPILIKMRTNTSGVFNAYGKFGVNTCFNYDRVQDYSSEIVVTEKNDIDFNADSRSINLGILVGAGAEFNISGTTSAFAGITYHQGFLNQLKGSAYQTDDNGVILQTEFANYNNPSGDKEKATMHFISLDLGVFF